MAIKASLIPLLLFATCCFWLYAIIDRGHRTLQWESVPCERVSTVRRVYRQRKTNRKIIRFDHTLRYVTIDASYDFEFTSASDVAPRKLYISPKTPSDCVVTRGIEHESQGVCIAAMIFTGAGFLVSLAIAFSPTD